jgi:hypothetical protein
VVASTALAGVEGDLATPVGFVGLACGAVAAALLGVIARRGLADRARVAASVETLGSRSVGSVPSEHRWW